MLTQYIFDHYFFDIIGEAELPLQSERNPHWCAGGGEHKGSWEV